MNPHIRNFALCIVIAQAVACNNENESFHKKRASLGVFSRLALTSAITSRNDGHDIDWKAITSLPRVSLCKAISFGELNGNPSVLILDNAAERRRIFFR